MNTKMGWVFGAFMIFGFANLIFLVASRNARLKRLVLVVATVVIAMVMLTLASVATGGWGGLVLLPVLVFGLAFNARKLRFCDACGFTNFLVDPLETDPHCGDCGKPLDTKRGFF